MIVRLFHLSYCGVYLGIASLRFRLPAAQAGSAPRSAAHPHQLTGPGFRPREDATTVASARAEEIQGKLASMIGGGKVT